MILTKFDKILKFQFYQFSENFDKIFGTLAAIQAAIGSQRCCTVHGQSKKQWFYAVRQAECKKINFYFSPKIPKICSFSPIFRCFQRNQPQDLPIWLTFLKAHIIANQKCIGCCLQRQQNRRNRYKYGGCSKKFLFFRQIFKDFRRSRAKTGTARQEISCRFEKNTGLTSGGRGGPKNQG